VTAADAFCGHCGHELADGPHDVCASRLELEPPRFCGHCRRRMVVQVTPRAWTATCVEHGTLTHGWA
jgi:hypothetical protein